MEAVKRVVGKDLLGDLGKYSTGDLRKMLDCVKDNSRYVFGMGALKPLVLLVPVTDEELDLMPYIDGAPTSTSFGNTIAPVLREELDRRDSFRRRFVSLMTKLKGCDPAPEEVDAACLSFDKHANRLDQPLMAEPTAPKGTNGTTGHVVPARHQLRVENGATSGK